MTNRRTHRVRQAESTVAMTAAMIDGSEIDECQMIPGVYFAKRWLTKGGVK